MKRLVACKLLSCTLTCDLNIDTREFTSATTIMLTQRYTHKIHNTSATRALMAQLFDPQMATVADFDCFSQAVFRSVEDYKRMKEDPWYKEHLVGDHEKFADTKRSM